MAAERKFVDDRVQKVIDLKNKVSGCGLSGCGLRCHSGCDKCLLLCCRSAMVLRRDL